MADSPTLQTIRAIAGMPIIEADRARLLMVEKRGMSAGYSGIENPICYNENTRILFADAEKLSEHLVKEFQNG